MAGTALPDYTAKLLDLLKLDPKDLDENEICHTPIFTESVRRHSRDKFTQYGLLGGDVSKLQNIRNGSTSKQELPFVYHNIRPPSSVFICGSQGSGKSHTLSCLLENCLIPSDANVLPQPLTGVVFHYDPFSSDTGGQPCEAAYLSSHPDVKVRVLCAPTNVRQIKALYEPLPNVHVQELRLGQENLNTKRMFDLMAVSSVQGAGLPLYFHVITRILRDLRIQQQKTGAGFNYQAFKKAINRTDMTPGQKAPLEQRLDTLESFMAMKDVSAKWEPQAGQLTIVDLSCPCVTADSACALFNICLNLFLEQETTIGRIVALDEAHKYMTDSSESSALTDSLLTTIRVQRHLGTRVMIATQEPTISSKLLDLCSLTIVHRFTSPDWLATLKKHLAAATGWSNSEAGQGSALPELFERIVALRQGEALLFCPSALVDVRNDESACNGLKHEQHVSENGDSDVSENGDSDESEDGDSDASENGDSDPGNGLVHLRQGYMHIRVRDRITHDGGQSVMAG